MRALFKKYNRILVVLLCSRVIERLARKIASENGLQADALNNRQRAGERDRDVDVPGFLRRRDTLAPTSRDSGSAQDRELHPVSA